MHSGGFGKVSPPVPRSRRVASQRILDGILPFWYFSPMLRRIVKVNRNKGNFRINIPQNIIQSKRWDDVLYVLIEEGDPNTLIVRRFIDAEGLKTEDR